MKSVQTYCLVLAAAGVFLSGCQTGKAPDEGLLQPGSPDVSPYRHTTFPQSATLGAFTVKYLGRTVDIPHNRTTFRYVVTGPKAQVTFILEVPPCATEPLLSYTPSNGVNLNVDHEIYPSIRWNPPTKPKPVVSDTFSYTFGGIVKEGDMQVGIKTASNRYNGTIAGPSKVFDISGSVFTDADEDGMFDSHETGIGNVTVYLVNSSNVLAGITTTSGSGSYLFHDILCGPYTVRVDTNTVTSGTHKKYLSPTTPGSRPVLIGPDSPGNDFGFSPKTDKLLEDIGTEALPTNGASPQAWKEQFDLALDGEGEEEEEEPVVSRDTLLAYLSRINSLALPDPFIFTLDSAGLASARSILCDSADTDLSSLLQELLATELNYERGLGLSDQSLQLLLIGWGESIASSVPPSADGLRSIIIRRGTVSGTGPGTASQVFSKINSGGGGGIE